MEKQSAMPLYQQIYETLKEEIEAGTYRTGSYLPSERALGERFAVQRMTLRRALALLEQERYIQKRHGAGSQVIHNVETTAPSKNLIAYAMPGTQCGMIAQPYHMEICNHLEKQCAANGYSLLFTRANPDEAFPSFLNEVSGVRGVIWVGYVDQRILEAAARVRIPSIQFANDHPGIPKINIDDHDGALSAVRLLIGKGCKQILHLTGEPHYINAVRRLEGYRRGLLLGGLPFREELVLDGDWNFQSGYEQVESALHGGCTFDGVFAANDMMALGALKAVLQAGKRVPEDVKIIGMDNIEQSLNSTPALSTVSVSQRDVAQLAFLLLRERIAGRSVPDEVIVPATLVERETT